MSDPKTNRDAQISRVRRTAGIIGFGIGFVATLIAAPVLLGVLVGTATLSAGTGVVTGVIVGFGHTIASGAIFISRIEHQYNEEGENKILFGAEELRGSPARNFLWGVLRGVSTTVVGAPIRLAEKIVFGVADFIKPKEREPGKTNPLRLLFSVPSVEVEEKAQARSKVRRLNQRVTEDAGATEAPQPVRRRLSANGTSQQP